MNLTYPQALDEMFTLFRTAWNANTTAIAGYIPETRWPDVEETTKPDKDKFWCRVSTQNFKEQQATLSDCVGVPGKKRFNTVGRIYVQLFCPKSLGNSKELGDKLAVVARDAFRGKQSPGGVWFRDTTISNLSPEALFYRINVTSDFNFDEIG